MNVAEAVNYASFDWLNQLPNSRYCTCRKSSVRASHEEILKNLSGYNDVTTNPAYLNFKRLTEESNTPELGV